MFLFYIFFTNNSCAKLSHNVFMNKPSYCLLCSTIITKLDGADKNLSRMCGLGWWLDELGIKPIELCLSWDLGGAWQYIYHNTNPPHLVLCNTSDLMNTFYLNCIHSFKVHVIQPSG